MRLLNRSELRNLSFPDYAVEDMVINIRDKELIIKTDGGYLAIEGGVELGPCELVVKNWQSIRASIYHTKTKKTEILNVTNIGNLAEICEFETGNGDIILRGFGVKGGWIEIVILNGAIEVKVDE